MIGSDLIAQEILENEKDINEFKSISKSSNDPGNRRNSRTAQMVNENTMSPTLSEGSKSNVVYHTTELYKVSYYLLIRYLSR